MTGSRRGRNDPERAERIIAAALEVIADAGVHVASHRRIAARAGVPLGSLTYYFADLREIHESAFRLLAARMSDRHREAFAAAHSRAEAAAVVVELIVSDSFIADHELRAIFQMYAYGNHDERVRDLCGEWLRTSWQPLEQHFSASASRALGALIEGWPIHRMFEGRPLDRRHVEATVTAIADGLDPDVDPL